MLGGSSVARPIAAGSSLTQHPRPALATDLLINIVLGKIGLIAAARLLPADETTEDVSIDTLGAGLLGAMMLGLIYGLIEGSNSVGRSCRASRSRSA